MKCEKEIEINLTPREIIDELWDMDDFQQAEVLFCLAHIYQANHFDFLKELDYIRDRLDTYYTDDERKQIEDMIGKIAKYLGRREP